MTAFSEYILTISTSIETSLYQGTWDKLKPFAATYMAFLDEGARTEALEDLRRNGHAVFMGPHIKLPDWVVMTIAATKGHDDATRREHTNDAKEILKLLLNQGNEISGTSSTSASR